MKLTYECECDRRHERDEQIAAELSGYSTDIKCDCGAMYAVSVTMLRPSDQH